MVNEVKSWCLPPHCGNCGSLLVGRFCGRCGAAVPAYPAADEPLAWLLLPRHKDSHYKELEGSLGQLPGYREEVFQDDILHALPVSQTNWQTGSLGLFLPKLLSWPGAAIKTYSGWRVESGTPAMASFAAYFAHGGDLVAAPYPPVLAQLGQRVDHFAGTPYLLPVLSWQLLALPENERLLLITPHGGRLLQQFLAASGGEWSRLAKIMDPLPTIFYRSAGGDVAAVRPPEEHPASRLTALQVPEKPQDLKLIAPDTLLYQNESGNWYFVGPEGASELLLPGKLEQIWTFIDSTALLAVRHGAGRLPLLLKAPLSTVKKKIGSDPFQLLFPRQPEPFEFSFDPLSGALWVLYAGGQYCLYNWNRARQTYVAERSWQVAALAGGGGRRHNLPTEELVSLAPHYLLTREVAPGSRAFYLYYFQKKEFKRAHLDLQLRQPRLLTATAAKSVLLLDGAAMYEAYISNNSCKYNEILLPGQATGWSVERQKIWLSGDKWLLSYQAREDDVGYDLYPVSSPVFVTQLGPMLVDSDGHVRQYLAQAGNSLPFPPWPQREDNGKLQKALALPPAETTWNKELISIISERDLGALLSFCVSTIDRSGGLILERRVYIMLQEIEKRRWYVASKAVGNYYADRSNLPNIYLELSLIIHQYLWQNNREELRQRITVLAAEAVSYKGQFILDKLAQLYLLVAQELWQGAYELAASLQKEVQEEPAVYDFLLTEIEHWYEVIAAMAYGDNLKNSAPEEWFICRLAAILRNMSDAHLTQLVRECGSWLTRIRNI